jgi:hypothetical protein
MQLQLTEDEDIPLNITKTGPLRLITNIWFAIKIIWFIVLLIWGGKMLYKDH